MSKQHRTLPILMLLCPSLATAFCVRGTGPWEDSLQPIRVRIDIQMTENPGPGLDCSGGCSMDAISWAIRANLDEFYDNSGADLRFEFDGTIDSDGRTYTQGELVVHARENCPGGRRAWANWRDSFDHTKEPPEPGTDGRTDEAYVAFCTNGLNWGPWMDGQTEGFTNLFIHEVMHTLDFLHPHDDSPGCEDGTPTVLSYSGIQSSHLYKDDIDGLQLIYGLRLDRIARSVFSLDQLDWIVGPTEDITSTTALGRLNACDNLPSASTFVGYTLDSHLARVPRVSIATPAEWQDKAVLSLTEKTHYPVGIGCASSENMRLFYLGDYPADPSSGRQRIKYFETDDGWNSVDGPFVFDEALEGFSRGTNTSGLDATFDPSSGKYVVVWRTSGSQITSKVEGATPSFYTGPDQNGLLASDTPSVACGDRETLGEWNCIIAWSDTDWYRTLRWAPAKVVTTPIFGGQRLELGEIRSQGYIVVGGPSVAIVNALDFPWQIAFHQGGYTTYVFRKSADPSALWQDERGFSFPQKVVAPGLGSVALGPFRTGMVFTTSSD